MGGDGRETADEPDVDAPRPLQAACAVLALQVLALIVLAGFIVVDTISGNPHSVPGALLDAALALAGAAALGLAARGLLQCRPAARTPVVVIELISIPVAYSLGFQAGRIAYGGPMLLAALAVIYLLFTPPSRAALDREPPG